MTLDQSVFDGLPTEYRWAAVSECGSANAFNSEPKPFKADFRDWDFNNVDTVLPDVTGNMPMALTTISFLIRSTEDTNKSSIITINSEGSINTN